MSTLLETLSSYVPNLILRRIVKNPEPITAPTYESFPAAVMYADIKGFTALTERLEEIPHAQQGAGAEAVTHAINAYFERFIDVLHAHGGDIVKFTGDGVLAIWATETNLPAVQIAAALRDAVRRASQCGLAVQKALENYQTADGIPLSMRIGIGAGDVSVVHLGGVFNRWELLVGGDPVVQSHAAERRAQPGEVILSPLAYRLIRTFANGTPLSFEREEATEPVGGEGVGLLLNTILEPIPARALPEIKLAPHMEAALRPYIPAAILTRLDAGQSAWLSELRRVTVLFINLPNLNNFQVSALERAQLSLRELQRTIYKQQGSLNKLSVDEKGATLVAALGLPPLSHADDPERGARAGFETVQTLKALGMEAFVGVTTGLTFSGVIGSDRRREYTMMGDTVNLAARLMQATKNPDTSLHMAGGPVLCDLNTYVGANASLQFEVIPPIKVKGKRQPIPVFQPIRVRNSPIVDRHDEWARALVGRAEERFTVAEQLQELQRGGAGGVFVIEGEAGIGKSRLVKEIMEQAKTLGIATFLGVGDVVERENLYHVWQPIFRQILEVDEFSSTTNNKPLKKIVRLLSDPEILRFYPLLSEVLDSKIDENEYTIQMEGLVRATNTRQLLVRIFEEVCKQTPTVLVLEDTQ
ncbi:MAG TPA: adenylate/guanylate cyclase domain-containing protein, partial [Anaerolineales bacterium]|nr:adenylate/guanylate cyclase domain-containing protein [Anaerolineales bacterium]